jgi:hypothetical protein
MVQLCASNRRRLEAGIRAERRARISGPESNHKIVASWNLQEIAALKFFERLDRVLKQIEESIPDFISEWRKGWRSILDA